MELVSIAERALVFATTGNAKVLHRASMAPTLLSKGLITTGFPAIHRSLWTRRGGGPFGMDPTQWPGVMRAGYEEPVSSVFKCLAWHYSKETAYVSPQLLG